jgi:hypothetical protein
VSARDAPDGLGYPPYICRWAPFVACLKFLPITVQWTLVDPSIGIGSTNDPSQNAFARGAATRLVSTSRRVLAQDQRQRGPKIYSLHAPEVECIGKGKAHRPHPRRQYGGLAASEDDLLCRLRLFPKALMGGPMHAAGFLGKGSNGSGVASHRAEERRLS